MRRELHAGWLAMSVLLGSTAATSSVRGEERAKPPSSEVSARDVALRDFEEGRREHIAGRLEEAELLYLRAWARMKSFDIAVNLGQVQLRLNKPVSAANHLAYGVRTVGPEIEPERLARMLALLDEAKAQVGAVRLQGTDVADAEVFVDGERVPEDAVKHELYVDPGEHTLVIRRAGYEDEAVRLVAAPGVTETVMPELTPKAVKAPETTGPEAKAPAVMAPMPRKAGWSSPPTVPARPEGPRTAVLIGGAATAGAAAIAGVVLTFLANANGSDADTERSRLRSAGGTGACGASDPRAGCRELSESVDDRYAFSNAAFWSFASAGAVGVGTLVYGLATRRSVPDRHVHVTPIVRASSLGIVVGGVL
ncbi:hypothetical protein WMF39_39750 [Sorangium sp. So ce1504]|uniref:hypothetical protein n=1 Tax=Sorangium sp. So ce1504 TaxID=3133337 RepID=UPI003F611528